MWRASLVSEARRAVVAHNSKTARRLITQSIQQRLGDHSEIVFEIVLPEKQRAALESYLQEQRQSQPGQSLLASRVACAKALLALQLTQEEVAELMGISRPLLAVSLHRAASRAKPRRVGKAQAVSANLQTGPLEQTATDGSVP
jgi:hypothetical protein